MTTSASSSTSAAANPIRALQGFGQSFWLDDLQRSLFTTGQFKRLIDEDGLRGVTSNPSIVQMASTGSSDYLEAFRDHGRVWASLRSALKWKRGSSVESAGWFSNGRPRG